MATLFAASKQLTQAELELHARDDSARAEFERISSVEFESWVQRFASAGARGIYAVFRSAEQDYRECRREGDWKSAATFLRICLDAADKLAARTEKLRDRRDRAEAGDAALKAGIPVVNLHPIAPSS